MEIKEIKKLNIALQLIINDNLRSIRLLYDKLKSTDRKYLYAGTPPQEWLEQHKDFFSLKRTTMTCIQSLMNSNKRLFVELEKLASLLPDKDAGMEDVFTNPLKESRDRLEKLVKEIKIYMPR